MIIALEAQVLCCYGSGKVRLGTWRILRRHYYRNDIQASILARNMSLDLVLPEKHRFSRFGNVLDVLKTVYKDR